MANAITILWEGLDIIIKETVFKPLKQAVESRVPLEVREYEMVQERIDEYRRIKTLMTSFVSNLGKRVEEEEEEDVEDVISHMSRTLGK